MIVCVEESLGKLELENGKTAINVKRPRLNHNLSARDVGVAHLAAGGIHAAALTHDGSIYTLGLNYYGALGETGSG